MEADPICFLDAYPDTIWNKSGRVFTYSVAFFQYQGLESLKDSSFEESTKGQNLEVKINSIIMKAGRIFLLDSINFKK